MKENTKNSRKVCVLMAVYNPNIQWLKLQLNSLENQTYGNMEIIALNDCSTTIGSDELRKIFGEIIKTKKWRLTENKENYGSNKSFEILTDICDGDFLAYCDQDDIWYTDKIEKSVNLISDTKSILVCGNMRVIDENGNVIAEKIEKINKKQVFYRGENLTEPLLKNNFVTGCTMLIESRTAKRALPFIDGMFHDYYLAIYASLFGRIDYTEEPLLDYRIHSSNQSGFLAGVLTKSDYYKATVEKLLIRNENLVHLFNKENRRFCMFDELLNWTKARNGYRSKPNIKDFITVIKGIKFSRETALFEAFLPFMPEKIFDMILKWKQREKIQ